MMHSDSKWTLHIAITLTLNSSVKILNRRILMKNKDSSEVKQKESFVHE